MVIEMRSFPRFGLVALTVTVVCLYSGLSVGGEPPVNEHNLTVSQDKPFAHMNFQVVQREQAAALNTKPAEGETFIAGTGRVVETMRHGEIVWIETQDKDTIHSAQCARVPANTPSHVICLGQFVPRQAGRGGRGSGGSGGGQQEGPAWRSELSEPGTHVIVANSYNRAGDTGPGPDGTSFNLNVELSARALSRLYATGADRVVLVTCGLAGTNITDIAQLPAHLAGLNPPVQQASVISFDTLGHGHPRAVMQATVREMLCARRAPQDAVDAVGRLADFGNEVRAPEVGMDSANYAQIIKPYLKDYAFVSLYHCYTGEGYVSPINGVGPVPSVAGQVKAALPGTVTTLGVSGMCRFATAYDDKNGNDRWDPGEPIEGGLPRPEDSGNSWQVNHG